MSGIVGILNLDGAPLDRLLLQRMTEFMAFRGPDGQEIWVDGHVGLGHTMLRTTYESAQEQQPCSLDGQVWITADARIDARSDLIQKLEGKSPKQQGLKTATDPELILHAYHAWGKRLRRASARRFRLCHLGRAGTATVLRPRSFRDQAVLLCDGRGLSGLQQHAELCAIAPGGLEQAERSGYRRLPSFRPEPGPRDQRFRRHHASAAGAYADLFGRIASGGAILDAAG